MLGPLAIENAAGRSVAPARTSFDPASDFYRPPGSSVREGLKGGQVLITDVTYNKDHSPGVVGLPTASREWRRQLAVVPCRDTKPACGRSKYRIPNIRYSVFGGLAARRQVSYLDTARRPVAGAILVRSPEARRPRQKVFVVGDVGGEDLPPLKTLAYR